MSALLMVKTTSIVAPALTLRLAPQCSPTASPTTTAAPRRAAADGFGNNLWLIS